MIMKDEPVTEAEEPQEAEESEETGQSEEAEQSEDAEVAEEPGENGDVDPEAVAAAPEAPEEIRRAIEALILVADNPVAPSLLAQLTEVSAATVVKVCEELAGEYEADNRGFVLVNVAGGYRFQTHTDLAPYIERFALEGQSSRLSAAALETLAIIAYKQPLSRAQVAAIRGVNADAVMRTLHQRGYIDEVPRQDGEGLAVLFRTTDMFLERIGLSEISELPALGDFAPGAEVVEALEQSLSAEPVDDELLPQAGDQTADVGETREAAETVAASESAEADEPSDTDDPPEGEPSDESRLDAVVIDLRDAARSEHD